MYSELSAAPYSSRTAECMFIGTLIWHSSREMVRPENPGMTDRGLTHYHYYKGLFWRNCRWPVTVEKLCHRNQECSFVSFCHCYLKYMEPRLLLFDWAMYTCWQTWFVTFCWQTVFYAWSCGTHCQLLQALSNFLHSLSVCIAEYQCFSVLSLHSLLATCPLFKIWAWLWCPCCHDCLSHSSGAL